MQSAGGAPPHVQWDPNVDVASVFHHYATQRGGLAQWTFPLVLDNRRGKLTVVAHFNSSVSLVYRLVNFSTPRSTRASLGALAHHAPQDDHPDAFARVMAQITTPLGRQRPPLHMSPGDNRSVVQSVLSGLSNGPMAKDYRENIRLHPLWLRRTVFTVLVLSNRTPNGLPPLPS